MDNRTRVFGGLLLVGVLLGGIVGLLVWRGGQASNLDSTTSRAADTDTATVDSSSVDSSTVDSSSDDSSSDDSATEVRSGPLEEFVSEGVAFIEDLRGAPFNERPMVVALSDSDFVARVENDLESDFAEFPEDVELNTVTQRAIGFIEPDQTSDEILQLGVAPNRIDLLRQTGLDFDEVWANRIEGRYGRASASWIDIDALIAIKKRIDHPRHREDVRVLELVRERKKHGK